MDIIKLSKLSLRFREHEFFLSIPDNRTGKYPCDAQFLAILCTHCKPLEAACEKATSCSSSPPESIQFSLLSILRSFFTQVSLSVPSSFSPSCLLGVISPTLLPGHIKSCVVDDVYLANTIE